ncbi:hypothetical protein GOBAR_AA14316 [Gossypium barbadense]|uniref:Uncharacterized protein n=1 Tax=Gossypium barbadense TaxID=3634 RepID=A0A2P5XSR6_GOSBA|nr:hypothetical protein GOBAR_AA14316 [Gossypium barbadense]
MENKVRLSLGDGGNGTVRNRYCRNPLYPQYTISNVKFTTAIPAMTAIASVMFATAINAMRPKTRPRPQFKSLPYTFSIKVNEHTIPITVAEMAGILGLKDEGLDVSSVLTMTDNKRLRENY